VFLGKNAFSSQLPVQSSLCVQIDYSFAIFISKRTKVEGAEGVDCRQSVVAGIRKGGGAEKTHLRISFLNGLSGLPMFSKWCPGEDLNLHDLAVTST
tara:strand:+ start:195 stop:485 length:291 start_codon:yes stop_codon:yes gene_type:complete